ncbi:MAG: SRPBCC family protein [Betaproteobacteria bacterium]|nr:SRPBCC family protein [Betaproteobacteria bacterium]
MIRIYVSTVIDASADSVWGRIRDFNGLPSWHPGIVDSRIENQQRLLALSDYEFACTYEILESPMGVEHYVATLKLTPVTDGDRCFAEWSAEFECAEGRERELSDLIGGEVFQGGFNALKRHFARR